MKTQDKKEIRETILYLKKESLDTLAQIKEDPINVIWESGVELNDEDYIEAQEYIKDFKINQHD